MHNFRELKVWQKARALVKEIYLITERFPSTEKFGLTNQIRRASISIPSNIAEGCGLNSNNQLKRFLDMAQGSSCELETQIYLSFDLKLIDKKTLEKSLNKINEVQRMIVGFKNLL